MAKITTPLLLAAMVLLLSGCFNATNDQADETTRLNPAETAKSTGASTVEKFYPASPIGEKSSGAKSFVITSELRVKLYLIDKYGPGACYGLPAPITDETIQGAIAANRELADFLRQQYDLVNDLAVYNKINQINVINLLKSAGGQYTYDFIDGQCCIIKSYRGQISIIGQTITEQLTEQRVEDSPC